ncbi:unnamed protein product [Candidula unifasciata]|uniref:Secreted protein n=1 Tax=Candidula unifasciata TaxID=100452 RepID=A0A8S3YQJ6_9EUPU|nr:unnamed protein product [Candidula unifasciata]
MSLSLSVSLSLSLSLSVTLSLFLPTPPPPPPSSPHFPQHHWTRFQESEKFIYPQIGGNRLFRKSRRSDEIFVNTQLFLLGAQL